jgi:hypothetical protein
MSFHTESSVSTSAKHRFTSCPHRTNHSGFREIELVRRHLGIAGLVEYFIECVFATHDLISLRFNELSNQPDTSVEKPGGLPEH